MKINPGVVIGPTGRKVLAVLERYPKADQIYITSGFREEPGSHHNGLNWDGSPTAALDCGAYDDPEPNEADQRDMRDLAKWLMDNFASDLAELIHTTPYADDNGFYIQHGHWTSFDQATMNAHLNHVHVAMSAASAERILAKLGARVTPTPVESTTETADVWGWDASNWDWPRGAMDLVAARSAGTSFFVHKATEGSTWKDPFYRQGLDKARTARMPVMGAYHAMWPGDAEEQARAFFGRVEQETPWWKEVPFIWQGDFEKFGPREATVNEANAFMDELRRLTNGRGYLIGYVPRWLYGDSFTSFRYDLWASDYRGSGAPRPFKEQYQGIPSSSWNAYSGKQPRILQFASDAVTGTQPTTDANRFRGTLSELISLTGNTEAAGGTRSHQEMRTLERTIGADPARARRKSAMAAANSKSRPKGKKLPV